eukprot:1119215-Pelagomonas_calceolata.AAC.2
MQPKYEPCSVSMSHAGYVLATCSALLRACPQVKHSLMVVCVQQCEHSIYPPACRHSTTLRPHVAPQVNIRNTCAQASASGGLHLWDMRAGPKPIGSSPSHWGPTGAQPAQPRPAFLAPGFEPEAPSKRRWVCMGVWVPCALVVGVAAFWQHGMRFS